MPPKVEDPKRPVSGAKRSSNGDQPSASVTADASAAAGVRAIPVDVSSTDCRDLTTWVLPIFQRQRGKRHIPDPARTILHQLLSTNCEDVWFPRDIYDPLQDKCIRIDAKEAYMLHKLDIMLHVLGPMQPVLDAITAFFHKKTTQLQQWAVANGFNSQEIARVNPDSAVDPAVFDADYFFSWKIIQDDKTDIRAIIQLVNQHWQNDWGLFDKPHTHNILAKLLNKPTIGSLVKIIESLHRITDFFNQIPAYERRDQIDRIIPWFNILMADFWRALDDLQQFISSLHDVRAQWHAESQTKAESLAKIEEFFPTHHFLPDLFNELLYSKWDAYLLVMAGSLPSRWRHKTVATISRMDAGCETLHCESETRCESNPETPETAVVGPVVLSHDTQQQAAPLPRFYSLRRVSFDIQKDPNNRRSSWQIYNLKVTYSTPLLPLLEWALAFFGTRFPEFGIENPSQVLVDLFNLTYEQEEALFRIEPPDHRRDFVFNFMDALAEKISLLVFSAELPDLPAQDVQCPERKYLYTAVRDQIQTLREEKARQQEIEKETKRIEAEKKQEELRLAVEQKAIRYSYYLNGAKNVTEDQTQRIRAAGLYAQQEMLQTIEHHSLECYRLWARDIYKKLRNYLRRKAHKNDSVGAALGLRNQFIANIYPQLTKALDIYGCGHSDNYLEQTISLLQAINREYAQSLMNQFAVAGRDTFSQQWEQYCALLRNIKQSLFATIFENTVFDCLFYLKPPYCDRINQNQRMRLAYMRNQAFMQFEINEHNVYSRGIAQMIAKSGHSKETTQAMAALISHYQSVNQCTTHRKKGFLHQLDSYDNHEAALFYYIQKSLKRDGGEEFAQFHARRVLQSIYVQLSRHSAPRSFPIMAIKERIIAALCQPAIEKSDLMVLRTIIRQQVGTPECIEGALLFRRNKKLCRFLDASWNDLEQHIEGSSLANPWAGALFACRELYLQLTSARDAPGMTLIRQNILKLLMMDPDSQEAVFDALIDLHSLGAKTFTDLLHARSFSDCRSFNSFFAELELQLQMQDWKIRAILRDCQIVLAKYSRLRFTSDTRQQTVSDLSLGIARLLTRGAALTANDVEQWRVELQEAVSSILDKRSTLRDGILNKLLQDLIILQQKDPYYLPPPEPANTETRSSDANIETRSSDGSAPSQLFVGEKQRDPAPTFDNPSLLAGGYAQNGNVRGAFPSA